MGIRDRETQKEFILNMYACLWTDANFKWCLNNFWQSFKKKKKQK